ncbi:MAG: DUF952 domain-containing protein [Rhodobacteraceae bacterium]|nr:DUF952 domain-containing protein [Paracoccaceae bacterium]
MLIYKIFRSDEWAAMQAADETLGAPVDLADGFVHFSTAEQARETAARHFAGETGLWLIAADTDAMDKLEWETSRGGAKFPHLYAPFRMAHVVWAEELPLGADGHDFPVTMK